MCFVICQFVLLFNAGAADIVLIFCPVTKIQASSEWSATIQIQNNSGVVLDPLTNKFILKWTSLAALQWPFSNSVQNGTTWSFNVNLNYPGTLANGATATLSTSGNKFTGVLQFPTSGTFTQNGVTYTVEVKNCNETQNYELYDSYINFNRDCFLYSPAKLCLGQAATEIWKGEGVFDAMIPTNRPSWAIAVMVAHRLFTNLVRHDIVSPNFWMATAMNESRMTCDPTISPNLTGGHFPINGSPNTGTGVYNPTNNCFQILNIGYLQLANNQPDLFAQSNPYGTAQYSNVVDAGNWETGAIAMAYYHYQNMRYWEQIYCFNIVKTWKDAIDPYAVEKIFYHGYHDGVNAGISLLNDIKANYSAATSATNMNTVITTGGTWSQVAAGGSSQKVGNFTYLLDGNKGTLYPASKTDTTTQYLGCYKELIQWTDVINFLDEVKILYPKLQSAAVQSAIKKVFDGINGGSSVNFEDLGKVIDEIVIQMGGHDPSKYIAVQYAGSKTCPDNALGVSLRCNDTVCPGKAGELQVWLAGDKNFKFTLKYPDGSTQTFSNVDHSPFVVPITLPGVYEVISFEDKNELGEPNCLFSKIIVPGCSSISVIATGAAVCSGNCTTISATATGGTPPFSYLWNHAGQTTSSLIVCPTSTSSYSVIITDAANSTATAMATVTITPGLTAQISGNNPLCSGSSTTLSASGGSIFVWNTGASTSSIIVTPSSSASYSVVVKDANGCTGTAATTVSQPPAINSTVSVVHTACGTSIGSASVSAAGGTGILSYSWNPGGQASASVSNLAAGTYVCTITDANGCSHIQTASISNTNGPATTTSQVNVSCNGGKDGSAGASVTGGTAPYEFNWSSGQSTQNATGLAAGTYTLIVKDASGCSDIKVIAVTQPAPILATVSTTQASCSQSDGSATVNLSGGTAPYLFNWSNGQSIQNVSGLSAGNYSVVVTDVKGCSRTFPATVTNPNGPAVSVGTTAVISPGSSANLTASGGIKYSWSPATGLSCVSCSSPVATPAQTTRYCVVVTDANNCVDSACVTISVEEPCINSYYLPNAFSPNADAENDELKVYFVNRSCVKEYMLRIYDRWGEKVFESANAEEGWDGRKGNTNAGEMNTQVVGYSMHIEFTDGTRIDKHGNISLIR